VRFWSPRIVQSSGQLGRTRDADFVLHLTESIELETAHRTRTWLEARGNKRKRERNLRARDEVDRHGIKMGGGEVLVLRRTGGARQKAQSKRLWIDIARWGSGDQDEKSCKKEIAIKRFFDG